MHNKCSLHKHTSLSPSTGKASYGSKMPVVSTVSVFTVTVKSQFCSCFLTENRIFSASKVENGRRQWIRGMENYRKFFPALPVFGHVLLTNFVQEARANFCPLPFGRNKRLGCRLYLLYFFKNGFLLHIIIAAEYTGVFKIVYGIYSPPKFEGQVLLRKK